ncbi:hypothetical protein GCM10018790_24600 [Kitasatospora xanthocidica]|nr:hypothetical protein GCM10018790_24600 [Kitasatospora xanthocidica]
MLPTTTATFRFWSVDMGVPLRDVMDGADVYGVSLGYNVHIDAYAVHWRYDVRSRYGVHAAVVR